MFNREAGERSQLGRSRDPDYCSSYYSCSLNDPRRDRGILFLETEEGEEEEAKCPADNSQPAANLSGTEWGRCRGSHSSHMN